MAVNKICSVLSISNLEAHQIELCIVEACTNVIKHAYHNDPSHKIEIQLNICQDRIVFVICDTGLKMTHKPNPSIEFDPGNLEQLPTGKMGLFIINEIMSNITYENQNGINILTLTKNLHADMSNPF